MSELLVILVIVVIFFGATRLPQIGRGLGEGIRNFRAATREPPQLEAKPEAPKGREGASSETR